MNDAILSFDETMTNSGRDFSNRGYLNNKHIARFTLDFGDDYDLVREIITVFKESDKISDVNYKGESSYEVFSDDMIYPDYIEDLLVKWDIKIIARDIK
jgi:hypothetical protein